jgi:hypothetical protein
VALPIDNDTRVDGIRLFDPPPALRRFAAADVMRILVGLLALAVVLIVGAGAKSTVDGIEEDVIAGIDRLPNAAEQIVIGTAQIFGTLVPIVALGAILWRRRWRLLLHL